MQCSAPNSPLLKRTTQRILEELESGRYRRDEPLPSRREWARGLNVSHFTVGRAMDLLKSRGLIESREGSYTFLSPSAGGESLSVLRKDSALGEIHLWANCKRSTRRMKQAIVRRRFQKNFGKTTPAARFFNEKFDVPFSDFLSRQLENFIQGEHPTLAEFPQTYLEFLNDYKAPGVLDSGEAGRYLDLLNDKYLEHSFVDGKCRFLPFGCSYSHLVCNAEIFRQAGLNPDAEFQSWDDFADQCERLKAIHGVEPLHVSGRGLFWLLTHWVYQADPALPARGRLPLIDWQSKSARVGMDFLLEMFFDRKLIRLVNSSNRLAQISPFLAGQVPMVLEEIMLSAAVELDQTALFTLKALPIGPNSSPFSLMNTVGWVVNANADEMARRCAGQYIFEWERWIHDGEGGATMRRQGVAPSLNSLFKDPDKDRFYSDKLPENWKRTYRDLEECGRWEASDSDLVAGALIPILQDEFQKDRPVSSETLLKHLLLAQYDAGILDRENNFHPNQKL
ncbi:MAG: GntR family transcriptional regulator [Chthoniobacterales bacterium]|nr:GntR family transcriptional regulator [Chthoniobacterales bacterium]